MNLCKNLLGGRSAGTRLQESGEPKSGQTKNFCSSCDMEPLLKAAPYHLQYNLTALRVLAGHQGGKVWVFRWQRKPPKQDGLRRRAAVLQPILPGCSGLVPTPGQTRSVFALPWRSTQASGGNSHYPLDSVAVASERGNPSNQQCTNHSKKKKTTEK